MPTDIGHSNSCLSKTHKLYANAQSGRGKCVSEGTQENRMPTKPASNSAC